MVLKLFVFRDAYKEDLGATSDDDDESDSNGGDNDNIGSGHNYVGRLKCCNSFREPSDSFIEWFCDVIVPSFLEAMQLSLAITDALAFAPRVPTLADYRCEDSRLLPRAD